MDNLCYRINKPDVISELIDAEVVVLNLKMGIYYSLNESAVLVWQYLESGLSKVDVETKLTEIYRNETHETIRADLESLLEQFRSETLLIPVEEVLEAKKPKEPDKISSNYEKPKLEKFSDLQDLLLLDPIHDVNELGWPHAAV